MEELCEGEGVGGLGAESVGRPVGEKREVWSVGGVVGGCVGWSAKGGSVDVCVGTLPLAVVWSGSSSLLEIKTYLRYRQPFHETVTIHRITISEHELLPPSNMPYLPPVLITPLPVGIFRRLFFFSVSLSLPPGVDVLVFLFPKGCRVGTLSVAVVWSRLSSLLETKTYSR